MSVYPRIDSLVRETSLRIVHSLQNGMSVKRLVCELPSSRIVVSVNSLVRKLSICELAYLQKFQLKMSMPSHLILIIFFRHSAIHVNSI